MHVSKSNHRLRIGAMAGMIATPAARPCATGDDEAAGGEVKVIAPFAAFPEGPLWHDGKLYFTEYAAHTVMVWDGEKIQQVWKEDGCGANSVTDTADGNFLVACYDAAHVVKISPDGKT